MLWKKSLVARLVGYFLLLSIVAGGAGTYFAYSRSKAALHESVIYRLETLSNHTEDQLHCWVRHYREDLEFISVMPELRGKFAEMLASPPDSPEGLEAYASVSGYLKETLGVHQGFKEFFIISEPGGEIIVSTDKSREGAVVSDSPVFTTGRRGLYVGDIHISKRTGRPVLSLSVPITGEAGERIGVLGACINAESLNIPAEKIVSGNSGGELYLVDRDNNLIFEYGESASAPRKIYSEGINLAVRGQTGHGSYKNHEGEPVIGHYRWVEAFGVALLAEQDRKTAFAPAYRLALVFLSSGLGVSALLLVGVYILARQITRPIRAIKDTAVRVAEGDISLEAPVMTEDEIGVLARTFNKMTAQLSELYDTLKKRELHFRSLIENSSDMIFVLDGQGRFTYAGPSVEKIMGHDPGRVVQGSIFDFLHPDDREKVEQALLVQNSRPGEPISQELRFKDADDRWRVVEIAANNLLGDPAVKGIVVNCRDVTERKRAEAALRESEEKFKELMEFLPQTVFELDADGYLTFINRHGAMLFGLDAMNITAYNAQDLIIPDHWKRIENNLAALLNGKKLGFHEYTARKLDGTEFPVLVQTVPVVEQDRVTGVRGILIDITDLKKAQEEVLLQKTYFQQLFENSPLATVIIGTDGNVLDVNQGFENLFQFQASEVKGRDIDYLIVPDDRRGEATQISEDVMTGKPVQTETMRRRRDGSLVDVHLLGFPIMMGGQQIGCYGIYRNITDRKRAERQLTYQAFHDGLTGLANRALFHDRLERAIQRVKRREEYKYAVLYLDLDRFKVVNDSLGHNQGDQLLITVTTRLKKCLRSIDTVARIGGDEFAILLEEIESSKEALQVAKRIQEEIKKPVNLGGHEIHTSASMGIVFGPTEHDKPEFVLRDADIAMYRAKELGKDRFKIFHPRLRDRVVVILHRESELRQAIKNNEFKIHYQPILSVKSGTLVGFEALIRWNHPERGLIYPDEFIHTAEETGLIIPIGEIVFEKTCSRVKTWQDAYPAYSHLFMSVNLSVKQFLSPNLVDFVSSLINGEGPKAEHYRLEVTESAVMDNAALAKVMLSRLKSLGLMIAIDDFGTGYSSLSYLHQFPIDTLKVDRSFTARLGDGGEHAEIVRTIIQLAHNLGMDVIAEGVETPEQFKILKLMGCDLAQGYLFSPPVPPEQAEQFLVKGKKW